MSYGLGEVDFTAWYMRTFKGGLRVHALSERTDKLRSIHNLIDEYHQTHGSWPLSMADMMTVPGFSQDRFSAPRWSGGRGYRINFDRMGDDGDPIIVGDPGFDIYGLNPLFADGTRIVLHRSGRIAYLYEVLGTDF